MYIKILKSVYNIITQNNLFELKVKYIITDTEESLVNAINEVFPNIGRIGRYFHYKYDLQINFHKY